MFRRGGRSSASRHFIARDTEALYAFNRLRLRTPIKLRVLVKIKSRLR